MDYTNAVNFSLSDYKFYCDWDIMASATKAPKQEFELYEDSGHMFSQILPLANSV